jgi:hypothetical protein
MSDEVGGDITNKKRRKKFQKAVELLRSADMEFAIVGKVGETVVQHASANATLWLDLVDASNSLPCAIRLVQVQRTLAQLPNAGVTFAALERGLQRLLVGLMLDAAIPGRKTVLPYNGQPSYEQVVTYAEWWPVGVTYMNPSAMEPSQLVQVATSLIAAAVAADSSDQLYTLQMQTCDAISRASITAAERDRAAAAVNNSFKGETPVRQSAQAAGLMHQQPSSAPSTRCSRCVHLSAAGVKIAVVAAPAAAAPPMVQPVIQVQPRHCRCYADSTSTAPTATSNGDSSSGHRKQQHRHKLQS